ncbi:MAG: DUF1326 domain-containing protein [Planctomycetales bacterium]|nr:DUF1326 domain-containing protein [Planctomycetales bacterium]
MSRLALCVLVLSGVVTSIGTAADELEGVYVEARTCQVYTGPCFANGESGHAGKQAVLGWHISQGAFAGVDLAGQSVVLVVKASHTLGFRGFANAHTVRGMLLMDEKTDDATRAALTEFVLTQTGCDAAQIIDTRFDDVQVQLDPVDVTGSIEVGKEVHITARKARPGDCICSNESAYYPPLVQLTGSAPGVTIEGDVTARPLGTRWSIPDSRTAYLGRFVIADGATQVAIR